MNRAQFGIESEARVYLCLSAFVHLNFSVSRGGREGRSVVGGGEGRKQ